MEGPHSHRPQGSTSTEARRGARVRQDSCPLSRAQEAVPASEAVTFFGHMGSISTICVDAFHQRLTDSVSVSRAAATSDHKLGVSNNRNVSSWFWRCQQGSKGGGVPGGPGQTWARGSIPSAPTAPSQGSWVSPHLRTPVTRLRAQPTYYPARSHLKTLIL